MEESPDTSLNTSPASLTTALIGLCFPVAVKRNSLGSDVLFVGRSHPLFDFIHELYRTESLEVTNCNAAEFISIIFIILILFFKSVMFERVDGRKHLLIKL